MVDFTDINTYYALCPGILYLVVKVLVIRYILKKFTIRKIKIIVLVVAILFSPTVPTILWLFQVDIALIIISALGAFSVDIALVDWVRVIFEPLSALDDIEYDDTPSGL